MADFMQEQVTRKMDWYKIDGTTGITFLPMDDGPNHILVKAACGDSDELQELFGDFYNGTVQDVEPVIGYGARLLAPGYMDCTEWAVFDTAEQAAEYLTETYGDDYPDADEPFDSIRCDSCAMVSINGTGCHETGCPNSGKTWDADRQAWVRYVACRECGCDVEQGEPCDCQIEQAAECDMQDGEPD